MLVATNLFASKAALNSGVNKVTLFQSCTASFSKPTCKSKTYVIEVEEGITYEYELSTSTDDTVGIWNEDRFGYIVEVDLIVTNRSGFHTFSESGTQELFVQSPKSDVPSQFTFTVSAQP